MTNDPLSAEQNELSRPFNRTIAIFLISVLGLFLEMLLIRWVGTEIRIFAYLQNTILIVCFLGLGLGLFTCRQPIRFQHTLVPLVILLFFMAIPVTKNGLGKISEMLSVLEDFVIWANAYATSPWVTFILVAGGLVLTYCVMILVVDLFVPLGRLLGRLMDDHPNTIWAYSVNIAGSLAGTWLFVILSRFYLPPFLWFIVFAAIMLVFIIWIRRDWKINLALLMGVIVLSWFAGRVPDSLKVIWSPYQKLVVQQSPRESMSFGNLVVTVNNTGYQMVADLTEEYMVSNPDLFASEWKGLSQYDIPLLLHPQPESYLIVGAGSGNDAAGGLRNAVPKITAVEIDPAIISIGKVYHPEKPYESPNVRVVIDDARSFFATTPDKFDVIAFGLLDSHTTTSMTNARLDHYVYTKESIQRARSLLTEHGVMVLTFEAQKTFIADRMARVLEEIFGEAPIYFRIPSTAYGWGGVMFITGDLETARSQIAQNPRLSGYIETLQKSYQISLPGTTRLATDDWPYIYLQSPKIPLLFFLLAGLIALIFARSLRRWQGTAIFKRWHRSHWHFFFLGAGFLLLEVQNISKASVILGNTWVVNAVIVSGVLVMALLANWLVHRFPQINVYYAYFALIVTCVVLYWIDLAQFAFLPYGIKALIVGSLTTLPMLFSGIIFTRSFAIVEWKNESLGANMVGALVGALLQSVTFLIGIKALLLVVAALYLFSLLALPAQLKRKLV